MILEFLSCWTSSGNSWNLIRMRALSSIFRSNLTMNREVQSIPTASLRAPKYGSQRCNQETRTRSSRAASTSRKAASAWPRILKTRTTSSTEATESRSKHSSRAASITSSISSKAWSPSTYTRRIQRLISARKKRKELWTTPKRATSSIWGFTSSSSTTRQRASSRRSISNKNKLK